MLKTIFKGNLGLAVLILMLSAPTVAAQQSRVEGTGATQLQVAPGTAQILAPQGRTGAGSLATPGQVGVAAIKRCCGSGGTCTNVPSNTTSCGHFQTATTCDDDGQNCTNHGSSEFPED